MNNTFSIEQLFAERLLHVPDYQRGYAWEDKHRDDFLQDLELMSDGHHYTGTVVLHAQPDRARTLDEEGRSYVDYDIVDGQQRITTTVLLLDALRRVLVGRGRETLAAGIRKSYVEVCGIDGQPLYRLRLNRDCRNFFEEVVLADQPAPSAATIRSEERLKEARDQFERYFDEQSAREDFEAWAFELYQKLTQRLRFTIYQVDSAADVGVIFEVMNNRGKPLSELEKVKNYLLYLASKIDVPGSALADRVNQTWSGVFEGLMIAGLTSARDEDRLLRAHWLMAYNYDRRDWAGSGSIKDKFALADYQGRHRELLDEAIEYTITLKNAAIAFCDVHTPRRDHAFASFPANKRELAAARTEQLLRTRAVSTFLPILMAVRLRYAGDADKYVEMTQMCERFAFRVYRLAGRRSNSGRSRHFRNAYHLYSGKRTFDDALERGYRAVLDYCSDDRFDSEFAAERNWYHWSGLRNFLYTYEEYLAGEKAVRVPWHELDRRDKKKSVEHILPQTPSSRAWTSAFKKPERERWTHDLGNLVLTMHNAELSNRPFAEKKGTSTQERPCYANSVLHQERELERFDEWTPESLNERRSKLVEWAKQRWAVPKGVENSESVELDIDDQSQDWEDD